MNLRPERFGNTISHCRNLITSIALVGLAAVAFAGCGQIEPTGETSQAFTSACIKPGGDSAAKYPWEASYPLGLQHVYCEHQPTAFGASYWAPGITPCSPPWHETPGAYQVDVWLEDAASPIAYYCARVSLSGFTHYHLDYEPLLEMGWLTSSTTPSKTRRIDGLSIGPGVYAQVAASQSAAPIGCQSPYTYCQAASTPPGGTAYWLPITTWQGAPAASLDFYRPSNW